MTMHGKQNAHARRSPRIDPSIENVSHLTVMYADLTVLYVGSTALYVGLTVVYVGSLDCLTLDWLRPA